jgi:hypothetical protein
MYRSIVWLIAGTAWGAALWGALSLQTVPASAFGEHGVCGPWGCGPPVPVLLACHTFWIVLLGPSTVIAAVRLPQAWRRLLGILLVVLGTQGLLAVGIWESFTWLREASEWHRHYIVHRYVFALITLVDFPIIEVLVAGAGLWLTARVKSQTSEPASSATADPISA